MAQNGDGKVLKDKSGVGIIGDRILNYTVLIFVSYFPLHFSSFLCEIASSNERPEDNDVLKYRICAFLKSHSYCFIAS